MLYVGVTETVIPTAGDSDTHIYVAVFGGGGGGLLVVVAGVGMLAVVLWRKKKSGSVCYQMVCVCVCNLLCTVCLCSLTLCRSQWGRGTENS